MPDTLNRLLKFYILFLFNIFDKHQLFVSLKSRAKSVRVIHLKRFFKNALFMGITFP